MVDVIRQGVFQAFRGHRTGRADLASFVHPDAVAGEKSIRGEGSASAITHPCSGGVVKHVDYLLVRSWFPPASPDERLFALVDI